MGCDGGTIPRRDELVRVKKKPEQKDKDAEREFRWLHCALTQERLQEPIVTCGLGRLYSKQNVIEQLLESKDKMPESLKHIKSLKDIKTLKLTPNPAFTEEDKCEGLLDTRHSPYICSLVGHEMSGKFRFVTLWSCGCVMSERALNEIKSTSNVCPLCQIPYSVEDVVVLNGNEEDIELMRVKIEMRNVKIKEKKKEKKVKKEKVEALTAGAETNESNDKEGTKKDVPAATVEKKIKDENKPCTSKSATSIISKIKYNDKTKRPMTSAAAGDDFLQDPELKRLKTDYTVEHDPKATDVYKSLFTTHQSEKDQTRAHWVTYNPFYN